MSGTEPRAFDSSFTPLAVRSHDDMIPVLMHPEASGPATHYYMIRGGIDQKNITVWECGTVGGEYIKAFGHYHRDDFIETYTILSGKGILLLQERVIGADGVPINDEIASIKAVFVKASDTIEIPRTAGHALVNIGSEWLTTIDNSPVQKASGPDSAWPTHADYEPIKALHGFAYYIVEENGIPIFVKNPHYKTVPAIIVEP